MAGENGADEREMLLDRNLASVVRDAPYAVDHLSARSQRPIISRDTCACPDKKRYVSPLEAFVEKAFPPAQREFGCRAVRYVDGARDTGINDDSRLISLRLKYRISIKFCRRNLLIITSSQVYGVIGFEFD